MCPDPPLEVYAKEICAAAKIISAYCLEHGLPHPSFDAQAPSVTLPSTAPPNVLRARQTMHTASLKIQQLATEPNEYLSYQAVHLQNLACVRWLCHFRILSFIPLHGSVPYSEVAMVAGVPDAQLKSVARMAMLSNFLREPLPNEVGHSATSALFVTNPGMLDWALFMAAETAPCAMVFVEATERWGSTSQRNQTAFNIARNTDRTFLDYVNRDPDLSKKFAAYMKNLQSSESTSLRHLLNGFDWASLGEATVVDVGGSNGTSAVALATAFPTLRIVVQDLPELVASGASRLATEPETVRSRITLQAHNFFSAQPVRGADVYLMRMILHEWQFTEALAIVRHVVQAMKERQVVCSPPAGSSPLVVSPAAASTGGSGNSLSASLQVSSGADGKSSPEGAGGSSGRRATAPRLIIMETVLPAPGSVPTSEECLLRVRDLTMIQAFNSREREMHEWMQLFDAVSREENAQSPGQCGHLALKKIVKPFGSVMSLMELEWVKGTAAASAAAADVPEAKVATPLIMREPGMPSPAIMTSGSPSGRNSPAAGPGFSLNARVPGMAGGSGLGGASTPGSGNSGGDATMANMAA